MTRLRRYFKPGQIYFLTHVTHLRKPVLIENVDLLWRAFKRTGLDEKYNLLAWAIFPDHCHLLIDPQNCNLANLTRRIKLTFSAGFRSKYGLTSGRLWQHRYWDHIIRDETDMNKHIDYIHYNPVKYGLVNDPFMYEHTSIHASYADGIYQRDWGCKENPTIVGAYGE